MATHEVQGPVGSFKHFVWQAIETFDLDGGLLLLVLESIVWDGVESAFCVDLFALDPVITGCVLRALKDAEVALSRLGVVAQIVFFCLFGAHLLVLDLLE